MTPRANMNFQPRQRLVESDFTLEVNVRVTSNYALKLHNCEFVLLELDQDGTLKRLAGVTNYYASIIHYTYCLTDHGKLREINETK